MEMTVMRVHKTGNYTIMSNYHFKEKEMSLKAKGLLSLMLSLPDDWDYSINGLATLSKDGRDSVMGALKELEKFGYLVRTRLTDEKGKFKGYNYDIFEEPQTDYPSKEKPYTGNPNTEKPTQLITNKNNSVGIKTLPIKDKLDELDKRAEAPIIENPNNKLLEESMKPNCFVKNLIEVGYIHENDLFISVYNQFFNDLVNDYDFETVRSCLWYFTKRLRNGKAFDDKGNEIENKYGYLKASLENNARFLNTTYDPYSEESINDFLEKTKKYSSVDIVIDRQEAEISDFNEPFTRKELSDPNWLPF